MKFPAENSTGEQVCKWLKDCGPATAGQVREAIGCSLSSVVHAHTMGWLSRSGGGHYGYVYELKPHVRDFYSMGGKRYQGVVVQPRIVNVMEKPAMKGYEAGLRQNRDFRNMSFKALVG